MRTRLIRVSATLLLLGSFAAPQTNADLLDDMKEELERAGDEINRALGQDEESQEPEKDPGKPAFIKEQEQEQARDPEPATEPTDPRVSRVRDVKPVDRTMHSTTDGLRVRTLPGTDTRVAGSLSEDQVVRVTAEVPGRYSGYRWVRIELPGERIAYAAREFLASGRPETETHADATRTAAADDPESDGGGDTAGDGARAADRAGSSTTASNTTASSGDGARDDARAASQDDSDAGSKSASSGEDGGQPTASAGASGSQNDLDQPLTYKQMLDLYVAANADLAGNRDFRDAYARRYLCDGLDRVREDEFISRDLVLQKAGEKIKARRDDARIFRVRTSSYGGFEFGTYNPNSKSFPLKMKGEDIPARLRYTLRGQANHCEHGSKVPYTVPDPSNPVWPSRFQVEVQGLNALKRLKMPIDEARKLVRARKTEETGGVDREIALAFDLKITEGPDKPAQPDMLGRSSADHEELISTVTAKVVRARAIGRDDRVLQTWGPEAFENVQSASQTEQERSGPAPLTDDRIAVVRYAMAHDGEVDYEAIAANTPEAEDINEFERAEMIDRMAERLSKIEDPQAPFFITGQAAVGKYDLDRERFLLRERHSGTNWRAQFSNIFPGATQTRVMFAPRKDFALKTFPMPKQDARELLENYDLLNKAPNERYVDYRAVMEPVSYTEDGEVERPWKVKQYGDKAYKGPVLRVRVKEVQFLEKLYSDDEPDTLFVWTPDAET